MKRILFLNQDKDPRDKSSWSGTPNAVYCELKKYFDVDTLAVPCPAAFSDKIYGKIVRAMARKNTMPSLRYKNSIHAAEFVNNWLDDNKDKNYRAIFAIGSIVIANLRTDIPIIYLSDAVFSSMINYYTSNITNRAKSEGNKIQNYALLNSKMVILTSKWAKDAAIKDYGIHEDKIKVIHLGANLDMEVKPVIKRIDKEIHLLMIGVEWERKGADIAIECTEYLNKMDRQHNYTLHIVGCNSPYNIRNKNIKVYGYLNRNISSQVELLDVLRKKSNFFILPTKAECAGMVFCEASAYSLPSITYDTGGVSDYVINGKNGYRLPLSAGGKEYAEIIQKLLTNEKIYTDLTINSRLLYETEYRWSVFGENVSKIINMLSD